MKELLKKIKPETVMSVGLVVLGAAQMLLSNKKEQTDRALMKAEILDEIQKDLTSKKSQRKKVF